MTNDVKLNINSLEIVPDVNNLLAYENILQGQTKTYTAPQDCIMYYFLNSWGNSNAKINGILFRTEKQIYGSCVYLRKGDTITLYEETGDNKSFYKVYGLK